MITATDFVVVIVRCDDCKGEEWVDLPAGSVPSDAEPMLRAEGWEVGDVHRCCSCVSGDGLPAGSFGRPGLCSVDDVEPT